VPAKAEVAGEGSLILNWFWPKTWVKEATKRARKKVVLIK
jgi:hypothetical protein